jgi:hypothetical protein
MAGRKQLFARTMQLFREQAHKELKVELLDCQKHGAAQVQAHALLGILLPKVDRLPAEYAPPKLQDGPACQELRGQQQCIS